VVGAADRGIGAELAQSGERNLLIAPVGFIADHVEVLYDLDIGVQRIARSVGVRVERTPMLNDSPALVNALTNIVSRERVFSLDGELAIVARLTSKADPCQPRETRPYAGTSNLHCRGE